MEKTIEKARELAIDVDEKFKSLTELKLSDAIRLGSTNSEQAVGWGRGEDQCALHAGVQAAIALGFIEV